jgi:hypothetical protein
MASAATQAGVFGRIWSRYLSTLREKPLTTKMSTSAALYVVGDSIAQFGIEGRSFNLDGRRELTKHEIWDVSQSYTSSTSLTLVVADTDS